MFFAVMTTLSRFLAMVRVYGLRPRDGELSLPPRETLIGVLPYNGFA
jgi:hypothetical protein